MTDMMNNMMNGGGWGGFGLVGGLINVLLLVGLLALVVWVALRIFPTQHAGGDRSGTRTDSAEEILRERFARGEIQVEEYERSLKTLRGEPAQRTYEDIARETRQQRT